MESWDPKEIEIYLEVLGMLNGSEWRRDELEKRLSGIDPVLAQRVIAYGLNKGIIYCDNTKCMISFEYAYGDVETHPEYFYIKE